MPIDHARPTDLEPTLEPVGPNIFAYVQPDGTWWINNCGVIVGGDSVVLIDMNTHHHGDHTHGNYLTAPAAIVGHRRCRDAVQRTGIDHYVDVFEQPRWGELEINPPTITFDDCVDVWAGGTLLQLHHIERAHTDNDVVVWVAEHGVLFTGDLVFHGGTPFVVMGSVAGSLAAAERLRGFGADVIVPGHGPVRGPEVLDVIIGPWPNSPARCPTMPD